MLAELNKTISSSPVTALFGGIVISVAVASFLSSQVAEFTTRTVEIALSERITSVSTESLTRLNAAIESAEELQARVDIIRTAVDNLTTEQIQQRLQEVDISVATLTDQVDGLQQIISPKNASQILNVARMSQEIMARNALEERVNASLTESREIVKSMKSDLSTLQYWIWGAFLTLIGGLLGSVIYLAKLLSGHLIKQSAITEGGAARNKPTTQDEP